MKKVSSFLSAAMVAALGVVPLAASPASAVQRCVHHEEYGKDVSDSVAFDFCIRADEDEVRVSVENFTCNTDNPSNFLLQCVVSNGLVETRKNGSTTYDYLPHLEVVANQRYVRWETSHPGCEEGTSSMHLSMTSRSPTTIGPAAGVMFPSGIPSRTAAFAADCCGAPVLISSTRRASGSFVVRELR